MRIAFETSKTKWTSVVIRFFTKSGAKIFPAISHTFPIFERSDETGVEYAMSADEVMSNIIDVDRYRKKGYILRVYELPDRIDKKIWVKKTIERQNQVFYPWFELLWFSWRWFRRLFDSSWTGKNWINVGRPFCSEGTITTCREAGYAPEFRGINKNTTDAIELENIIINIDGAKMVEHLIDGKSVI